MARVYVREIFAKSIVSKSGIIGVDYTINPYVGCSHGCIYCYARLYTSRFWEKLVGNHEWGYFVLPKINAAQLLRKELKKKEGGLILLSSVTDPYLPQESSYKLTRKILKVLAEYEFPISILTKSPLVIRDLDIILGLKDVEVGFSISGLNSALVSHFEPYAPSVKSRLAALKRLSEKGIMTYAFISPILPGLTDSHLDTLFKEIKKANPDRVMVDLLRIRPQLWKYIKPVVEKALPDYIKLYNKIRFDLSYFFEIREMFNQIASKYGYELEWMY
ncbi:MAG: radical SAM protein [Thermoproteota archaeon]|nr:MAG: radical SAM protein [Candidatus Korarchaeota archaeon]RLG48060.1 MAG: radical SAM protein [Candidatus Korarchaeota archaeon]RLG53798.1 MAG: radical SAM protein [Candidatus Korarchaeota archaeon]